jgi:phage-related protein
MRKYRTLHFYDEGFVNFIKSQPLAIQIKFDKVFRYVEEMDPIPMQYFKKIQNAPGLFEVRIRLGTNTWRAFCFFEKGNVIVVLNGYMKKDQKTSAHEIKRALKLKNEYYEKGKK